MRARPAEIAYDGKAYSLKAGFEKETSGAGAGMDSEVFKEIMSGFPAGVTVVTSYDADGTPQGLTVSAFSSVSVEPQMVLVCLENTSKTLAAVLESGSFTVNFLSDAHEELAMRFASKAPDKFVDLACEEPEDDIGGPVILEGCSAHISCMVWQIMEAGDHHIVVGSVRRGGFDAAQSPLVYGERRFAAWRGID